MTDVKYDIYFRGEILPGQDEGQVKQKVAALFKADETKLAQLFSGKVNVVKKAADKTTAAKYQQAFKNAGAKVVITAAKPAQSSTPAPVKQVKSASDQDSKQPKAAQHTAEGDWGILPVGSDLLKPEERNDVPDANIDTSQIKMVSPFSEPEVELRPEPPAPDTSHISVAEVGEDMNPDRPAPVADLELDLSDISVADVGSQLKDEEKKPEVKAPDTSHIKLV